MNAPFVINEHLTGIALAYVNTALIADRVLPRITVGKQEYQWFKYSKDERFTVPPTQVSRRGRVNEVEFGASEDTSSTKDHGLEDPVPQADIDNAPAGYDPLGHATEALTDLILLDREIRVASKVFDPNSFAAGFSETPAAPDKWDQDTGNPIPQILDALNTPIMRPNVLVMGTAAFTALRTNPFISKAIHGNSGDTGIASRAQIASLFEVEELLVGEGWLNSAKPGQPMTQVRVWGDSCAMIYRNRLANNRRGLTFGWTAQWGTRIAGQWEDKNIGLRGGQRVRVGESVDEKIVANDCGYLIQSVTT